MADYQDRALLDISDILKKADIVEERLARAFAVKTGQVIQTPTLKVDGAATRQLSELDSQVKSLGQTVRATRNVWQTQALTDDETVASSRRLRDELLKLATAEDANIDTVLRATTAAAQAQRTMDQARGTVTKGSLAYNASLGIIDALGNLGGPAGAAAGLVGQYVVQGLTRSLHRGQGAVGAEADGLSDEIVRTLKAKLKIQSPSVVMEEIGGYVMDGLLSGFKNRQDAVLQAVAEVGKQIPNTFRAAAEGGAGLDGGSLVAPLLGGLESELQPIPELFQKIFGDLAPVAQEALGEVASETEEASLNIAPAFDGLAAGFEKASSKLSEFPAAAAPATAAASEAADAAGEAGQQAEEAGNGFEQLSGFLAVAAAGVTVFTAAVAVAVPKAEEFQASLAAIGTESDLTDQQLTELGAGLLEMSGRVGQSAQILAQASYDVVGAGVKGADTIIKLNGLTETSAKAASAGLTEVGVSANVITSALNAYGLSVDNAQHVSDVFFKTTATGKISFEQLANNMGEVLPKASTLGVSLEELGASAAALTSSGVPAAQAVTGINAALDNILKPTEEAKTLSKELGLQFNAAALQGQGWEQFLNNIQVATGGNTELLGRLFGSTEAVNAIFALTSSDGAPRFSAALDQIRNSAGATDEAFAKQSNTFKFAQQQYAAAGEAFQIAFGLKFLPALTKAAKGAAEFINATDKLGQNGAVQFALIVGGATLAASVFIKLGTAVKSATTATALFQAVTNAGGLRAYIGTIGGLSGAMTTLRGATIATTVVTAPLVTVALAVGAAFAGWKVGEWIGKLKLFGDATTTVNDKLTDFFATALFGADPELIRQSREAEEAQQRKALATGKATEAIIDSGAAERQLAEETKRADAARAAELETIRQQKLALIDLNKELGDRQVKLELQGKSEFLNGLGSLGQAFDDLREKFKAPFYVNGQLERDNPRLQEGLASLDAQREQETTALLDKELARQDDVRLKHERDVQSAKAGLLKDETERRQIELEQQVTDAQASYQKEIESARQNSQAPGLDVGQRQRFLDQATTLENQQAEQITAIRAKAAQDIAGIEAGRLRQTQIALRAELDAQIKVNGAATSLLQQQRDRALEIAGSSGEERLAIEQQFGPQLLRLQERQAELGGQAARATLLQTLGQQLKDAESAGAQRATQEKAARATYLSELSALELNEQLQSSSQVLAQEKRVQAERLLIYQKALDERLLKLKDATGQEITALERTLNAERAKAQAGSDGGQVTAIDAALKQVGAVKTENLSGFKTVLAETRKEAANLGGELRAIGQTPLTAAIKSAVAPIDSVLKGAQKQLEDLRKSFGQVSEPSSANTAAFQANEARLTGIVVSATTERARLKSEAEAKFERERQDRAEASTLTLAKRELDLGRLTIDGYARVLEADRVYWERRRDNALAGSQDREQAEGKLRENEDERLRLTADRTAYEKDSAAFSREQLQTALELATTEQGRAAALERLNASDQGRLNDLDSEIAKLVAQGGHEREILALKRERAGIQKDLAARQQQETEHARALTQSVLDRIDAENKLAEKQARTDAAAAAVRQGALAGLRGRVGEIDGQLGTANEEQKNKLLADRAGLLGQILDLEQAIAEAPLAAEREQQDLLTARITLRNKLLGLADDGVTVAKEGVREAEAELKLAQQSLAVAQATGSASDQRQAQTGVLSAEVGLLEARNALVQAPLQAERQRLDLLGAQGAAMLAMAGLGSNELAQSQLKLDISGRELVLANQQLAVARTRAEIDAALKGQAEARVNFSQAEGAVQQVSISQAKEAEQSGEAVRAAQREYARAQLKAAKELLDVSLKYAEVQALLQDTAGDEVLNAQRELEANQERLKQSKEMVNIRNLSPDDRAGVLREQIDLLGQIAEGERKLAKARVDAEFKLLDIMEARRRAAAQIVQVADQGVATAQLDLDLARERLALAGRQVDAPGLGRVDQNALLKQQIELSGQVAELERKVALAREEVAKKEIDKESNLLDATESRRKAQDRITGTSEDDLALAQAELDIAQQRLALVSGQVGREDLGAEDRRNLLSQQIDLLAQVAEGERKLADAQRARQTLIEELTLSEGGLRRELAGGSAETRSMGEAADALAAARVRVTQAEREYAAAQNSGNLNRIKSATDGLTGAIAGQRGALGKLADSYRTLLSSIDGVQSASEQLRKVVFGEEGQPFRGNREIDRFLAIQSRRDAAIDALKKALASGDKAAVAAATQELAAQQKRYRDQADFLKENGVDVLLSNTKVVEDLSRRVDDLSIQYDRETVIVQQKLDAAQLEAEAALSFNSAVQVFGSNTDRLLKGLDVAGKALTQSIEEGSPLAPVNKKLLAGVQKAADRLAQPTEAKESALSGDLARASDELRAAIKDSLREAGERFANAILDAAPPPRLPARTPQQQRQLEADLAARYANTPLPAAQQPTSAAQKGGTDTINNTKNTTNNWGGISFSITQQPGEDANALADSVVNILQRRADLIGGNC